MHIVVRDEFNNVRGHDVADELDCVTVGCDSDCQVHIPDARLAPVHLKLCRSERDGWQLEPGEIPADSPARHTRVFVNARDLEPAHPIRHNDEIMIAKFRLTVFLDDAADNAPRSAVQQDADRIRAHPLPAGSIVRSDSFGELHLRKSDLHKLTAMTTVVCECHDLSSWMSTCIGQLTNQFKAQRVWLGARRKGYVKFEFIETRRADGSHGGDPPVLETFEYRCGERGQLICISQTEQKNSESAMCIPLVCDRGILGMVYLESKSGGAPYGSDDLDLLTAIGAVMARQLECIVLDIVKRDKDVATGELSFIRELQSRMDPANVPSWDDLQVSVFCKPGSESAGNVYDVMGLPNNLAAFLCAHVSGPPTMAALAMAEVRAAFRMGGLHADPPHVLLRAANWLTYNEKSACTMDIMAVVMNPRTGAMQYATAGRIGAAIVDSRGSLRRLSPTSIPAVGSHKEFAYASESQRLDDGESMMLYTPGVCTASQRDGNLLSENILLEAFSDGFGLTASGAMDELVSELKDYFRHGHIKDDICLMMLHRE